VRAEGDAPSPGRGLASSSRARARRRRRSPLCSKLRELVLGEEGVDLHGLARSPHESPSRAALLALLVDADLVRGDHDGGVAAARALEELAESLRRDSLRAQAALASPTCAQRGAKTRCRDSSWRPAYAVRERVCAEPS
jgi:hypothetical protein